MAAERGPADQRCGDRAQHHHAERFGLEVTQDELQREEDPLARPVAMEILTD
jgi:hypothetical protein